MDNKRMKNIVIGLGAFTLITLGLGKFFDTRCESSCIGEAFAANTKDGLEGLGNFNIILDDDDDKIVINKGDGPKIRITTDGKDTLGGDEGNPARTAKAVTETVPGKDIRELNIKTYVTDWKVVDSADDQLHFVFKGYLPPKEWTVKTTGDKLNLEVTKKGPLEGELQLPKNFSGEINITNVNGDITVEKLAQASGMHLTTVSGDVNVKAVPTRILNINTVSGDVELQPTALSKDLEIDYNSVSGNLTAALNSSVKDFAAKTVSGNVDLKAGKAVGFEFDMEGISASFEGLPKDTHQTEGFGNRSAKGSFGADPKGKLTFNSVSGDFQLRSAD
jgi:DUF4097 and DUF4098 domain-containing protein YvlB